MAGASGLDDPEELWAGLLRPLVSLLHMKAAPPPHFPTVSYQHEAFLGGLRHPGTGVQVHELAAESGTTRRGDGNPALNVWAPAFRRASVWDATGTHAALKSPRGSWQGARRLASGWYQPTG